MGRSPCCSKEGVLNRGTWTATEDKILTEYIKSHGAGKWRNIPKFTGLRRCGKSCRLRWMNYLRPDIKRGNLSEDEEDLIIRLHKLLGNRWSLIAGRLPGRTDNEIKNHWNTKLSKKALSEQSANHSNHDKTSSPLPKRLHNYKESKDPSVGVIVRSKAVYCSPRGMISTGPHLKTQNQNADTNYGVQILTECNEEDQLFSFLAKEGNSSMTDYGVGGENSRSEILDFESSYKILIDRNNKLSVEERNDDQIIIRDADLAKVETLNMAGCDSDGAYNTHLDFEFPTSFLESAEEWVF